MGDVKKNYPSLFSLPKAMDEDENGDTVEVANAGGKGNGAKLQFCPHHLCARLTPGASFSCSKKFSTRGLFTALDVIVTKKSGAKVSRKCTGCITQKTKQKLVHGFCA